MSNVPRTVVDTLPPVYASYFLLTLNEECLFIESSAGVPAGEAGKNNHLPIHNRMAIPWPAAKRLAAVLNSALAQHDSQGADGSASLTTAASSHAAKLPRLEV